MRTLISLAAILLTTASLGWAQDTASLHFPSDSNCTGPNTCNVVSVGADNHMDLTLVATGVPNIKTNPTFTVSLTPGDTGPMVALKAANAICKTAVNLGLTCNGFIAAGCSGADCCGSSNPLTTGLTLNCVNAGTGFQLSRVVTADSISVGPFGPGSNIQNFMAKTRTGNTVGADFQPFFFYQFLPSGASGLYHLLFFQSGQPNPTDISADSAVFTTADSLQNELARKTLLAFPTLNVNVRPGPSAPGRGLDPALIDCTQSFGEIANPGQTFLKITGKVPSGQSFTVATGEGVATAPFNAVPALSPWGTAWIVTLIFLSGLWLLRRRVPEC